MATSPRPEVIENDEQRQQQDQDDDNDRKTYSVWDIFAKVCDTKAKCQLCGNIYNYASSSGNLKAHLARVHLNYFPDWDDLRRINFQRLHEGNKRSRASRGKSIVWKYFEKIDGTQEALCSFCQKQLSYRSTSHNLKMHLLKTHPDVDLDEQQDWYEDEQYLDIASDDESLSDTPAEAPNDASIWRYFETEGAGLSRCSLCDATTSDTKQWQHLTKQHPKVLVALMQASEDDDEKPLKQTIKRDPLQSTVLENDGTRKRKSKPHYSSSEDIQAKKTVSEQPQDLFLQYLGTLLKDMPHDVYLQLQMDIVNLVMKARLNLEKEKKNPSELTTYRVIRLRTPVRTVLANENGYSNGTVQSAVNSIVSNVVGRDVLGDSSDFGEKS